jgi:hypothetical protein
MSAFIFKRLLLLIALCPTAADGATQDVFPDGTPVSDWFLRQNDPADFDLPEKKFILTDYGIDSDSTVLQTEKIQAVIDKAAQEIDGGVVVIPRGVFLSGALFFKPNTHLLLQDGARLKGSDDISHFPILMTRMEGQSLKYFSALVNVDGADGFTLSGNGTIDGNGLRFWRAFWLRREFNPLCTNMDEMRPRLIYFSHCNNVRISGVRLINSPFWTTHLYKCKNVKLLNLYIFSPEKPVKAPSTDAVDIDACTNVLIKNCYMSVNDDAVALKGGKGPRADRDSANGGNYNIIIEDCTYGFCHAALTFGSESIHNRNILMRRCTVGKADRLLWLKMRPDTPQRYEFVRVEDVSGDARHFIYIKPWTQFLDLKGQQDMPRSAANHVTMKNITLDCETFFSVERSAQYELTDFRFENLTIHAETCHYDRDAIKPFVLENVKINPR